MTETSWQVWRQRLATEIATLAESEVVVLDHDVPPEMQRWSEPRRVLLVPVKPRRLPSGFLVQFVGQGQDVVMGTLAGPASLGGQVELDETQDRQIRALGWRGVGDPGHWEGYAPDYTVVDWPRGDADGLARITVEALAVQGATPGLSWRITRL